MKILWLINIKLPVISDYYKESVNPAGGWMITLSKLIPNKSDLVICYPDSQIRECEIDRIRYYGIKSKDEASAIAQMEKTFKDILVKENPDIIHIWGTEHLHSFAMTMTANKLMMKNKVVVSIQGLVSVYATHYMASLPVKAQIGFSLRDLVRQDSIRKQRCTMEERGKYEIRTLKAINNVIGRTNWDNICTNTINHSLNYHYNNEILREEFYKHEWNEDFCEKHSIFTSQAQNPIKGFHFLIEAAAILKVKYPDLKIYVAGTTTPSHDFFKGMGYARYLYKIAKDKGVEDSIYYVGRLSETEMVDRYLKSNVFVCPSSIENSPNSVGEAMLLGMPVVASFVGGVPDMLRDKEEGFLYPYDAPYMLAGYISKIFEDSDLAESIGVAARKHAMKTHSVEENYRGLLEIYESIAQSNGMG